MTNQTLISLKGVTVRSINKTVFEGLDLVINKGEHWALTGKSGSGKSALLELIAGKLNCAKGEFIHPFVDEYAESLKAKHPLVSWRDLVAHISSKHDFRNLAHTSNFYYQQRYNAADAEDAETVKQYLDKIKPLRDGEWTYARVIKRLNLQHLQDKHLIKLSNGETKRLLIASALIRNPLLLIMDNPLTGLDVETRKDLNKLFDEIGASGMSVIMATTPKEIPDIITHVALLDDGKVGSLPVAEFNPDLPDFSLPQTDHTMLKQLLSIAPLPVYKTIAALDNVVIRYAEKTILDGINWHIKQGERWALTGPNGAGKSTLLSLINADNPQAYANKITLFDKKRGSGESIWEIKQKIGFVSPELFQYFPTDNTCLQVIESGFYDTLGLFRISSPAKAKLAERWMQLLKIDNASTKLFKHASASTQRLCLLARALIKNPPLLIFDEPLQGLDTQQKEHFKHIIDEICNNSMVTLIFVTHYQEEIPDCVTFTKEILPPGV